jgi:hypothetical protein
MTDYSFATVEEFIDEVARPEIERQLDELIATEPDPRARQALVAHRKEIAERLVDQSRIRNLERRLADAEARLSPRRPGDALH